MNNLSFIVAYRFKIITHRCVIHPTGGVKLLDVIDPNFFFVYFKNQKIFHEFC